MSRLRRKTPGLLLACADMALWRAGATEPARRGERRERAADRGGGVRGDCEEGTGGRRCQGERTPSLELP